MSCDPIGLTELVFDELPADEAALLWRHARECAECGRTLQALREDRERFAAPRRDPPELGRLFVGIERRISEHPAARVPRLLGGWWHFPKLFPAAAGAAALVLVLLLTGTPHRAHLAPPSQARMTCDAPPDALEGTAAEVALSACLLASSTPVPARAEACF